MEKLIFITEKEAIARMNEWGGMRCPFLFIVNFDKSECVVMKASDISPDELLYHFPSASNIPDGDFAGRRQAFRWETSPESFESYHRSFDVVMRNLRAGNSFLTNLTCATPVDTDLTEADLFRLAEARYKLWLKGRFLCFSPEIFVRISDGYIRSFPMKGTIDASLPSARERVLSDEKEAAEHATITDLIRNDLSRTATEVRVLRYRYIDELRTHAGTLLQVSSEICGRLPDDYESRLGDILFSMLPAGSVTGAPKRKTVEIIREAESYDRGFYTGVAGFFDGKSLDSTVLIRYIETSDGKMTFKSGGGITYRSDARSEYEEMKQKVYVPVY